MGQGTLQCTLSHYFTDFFNRPKKLSDIEATDHLIKYDKEVERHQNSWVCFPPHLRFDLF